MDLYRRMAEAWGMPAQSLRQFATADDEARATLLMIRRGLLCAADMMRNANYHVADAQDLEEAQAAADAAQ